MEFLYVLAPTCVVLYVCYKGSNKMFTRKVNI
jgi:hypothetical protein